MDSIVHGVAKSWTRLSDLHFSKRQGSFRNSFFFLSKYLLVLVSSLLCGLFSCSEQRLLACCRARALSGCVFWALEHRLNCLGLTHGRIVLRHVGSSRIRGQIRISCIGRRTLYH